MSGNRWSIPPAHRPYLHLIAALLNQAYDRIRGREFRVEVDVKEQAICLRLAGWRLSAWGPELWPPKIVLSRADTYRAVAYIEQELVRWGQLHRAAWYADAVRMRFIHEDDRPRTLQQVAQRFGKKNPSSARTAVLEWIKFACRGAGEVILLDCFPHTARPPILQIGTSAATLRGISSREFALPDGRTRHLGSAMLGMDAGTVIGASIGLGVQLQHACISTLEDLITATTRGRKINGYPFRAKQRKELDLSLVRLGLSLGMTPADPNP